jgi:hypothetical protein
LRRRVHFAAQGGFLLAAIGAVAAMLLEAVAAG